MNQSKVKKENYSLTPSDSILELGCLKKSVYITFLTNKI